MVGFLSFHTMAVEVVRFLHFHPLTIEVEEDWEVSFHGFDPMLKSGINLLFEFEQGWAISVYEIDSMLSVVLLVLI